MQKTETTIELLSIEQVAEMLGCTVRTVVENHKDIPFVRFGKRKQYPKEKLLEYINKSIVHPQFTKNEQEEKKIT